MRRRLVIMLGFVTFVAISLRFMSASQATPLSIPERAVVSCMLTPHPPLATECVEYLGAEAIANADLIAQGCDDHRVVRADCSPHVARVGCYSARNLAFPSVTWYQASGAAARALNEQCIASGGTPETR